MKPNTSFNVLITVAQNKCDDATQRLGRATQEYANAQEQLTMLQQYRQDYADRLLTAGQSGVAMSNYLNFRRFISTLDEAIQQQNSILATLAEKMTDMQQLWQQEKQRLNAYETLHERRLEAHRAKQLRQEQRDMDEMSAAMFQRARYSS